MKIEIFLRDFDSFNFNIVIHTPEGDNLYKCTEDVLNDFGNQDVVIWNISVTSDGQPQLEIWS